MDGINSAGGLADVISPDFEVSDSEELAESGGGGRRVCDLCCRPARVCWCSFVPRPPLEISRAEVIILQHPNEAKRGIRTARMAELGISGGRCKVYSGRKFPGNLDRLREIFSDEDTFLLYPGKDSSPLEDIVVERTEEGHRLRFVVLDGTWDEARKLLSRNPSLQRLKKASLSASRSRSRYVVRTQPADACLSTVESVAEALAAVEEGWSGQQVDALCAPLDAMCNIQIKHGAVGHDSKEFKEQNSAFVKKNDFKRKKKKQVASE